MLFRLRLRIPAGNSLAGVISPQDGEDDHGNGHDEADNGKRPESPVIDPPLGLQASFPGVVIAHLERREGRPETSRLKRGFPLRRQGEKIASPPTSSALAWLRCESRRCRRFVSARSQVQPRVEGNSSSMRHPDSLRWLCLRQGAGAGDPSWVSFSFQEVGGDRIGRIARDQTRSPTGSRLLTNLTVARRGGKDMTIFDGEEFPGAAYVAFRTCFSSKCLVLCFESRIDNESSTKEKRRRGCRRRFLKRLGKEDYFFFLASPGRYSSSAISKAAARPTMSSPGRRVSRVSASRLRASAS